MPTPLDDERLQFYLRHRDDIQEWAGIEREVVVATREILAGTQVDLDEQIARVDGAATTIRDDRGKFERIIVRRANWPVGVGVALEWELGVDPFGRSLPKYGLLFLNDDSELQAVRAHIDTGVAATAADLTAAGFKAPGERWWPVVRLAPKSKDWWKDPDSWAGQIIDGLIVLWPKVAPIVDQGLTFRLDLDKASHDHLSL